MYLWQTHVDVWQKSAQYCKAIILQFKINFKTNKHGYYYRINLNGVTYKKCCTSETSIIIGWFKLRGFACMGTAVKMGRGMPDLYTDRHV